MEGSPLYWGGELMETPIHRSCFHGYYQVAPLLGWRINGNTLSEFQPSLESHVAPLLGWRINGNQRILLDRF